MIKDILFKKIGDMTFKELVESLSYFESRNNPYVDIEDAAKISTFSHNTIRNAIKANEIHAWKKNGKVLMYREELYSWIENRDNES